MRRLHELTQTDIVTISAVTGDYSGGGAEVVSAGELRVAEKTPPWVPVGVWTRSPAERTPFRGVWWSMSHRIPSQAIPTRSPKPGPHEARPEAAATFFGFATLANNAIWKPPLAVPK